MLLNTAASRKWGHIATGSQLSKVNLQTLEYTHFSQEEQLQGLAPKRHTWEINKGHEYLTQRSTF